MVYFLFGCIGVNEGTLDAQFFQRDAEQVECTSVDGRRAYEVVACLTDIENGIEVGSLADEVSIAPTPPSNAAIFAATASLVGFCKRV